MTDGVRVVGEDAARTRAVQPTSSESTLLSTLAARQAKRGARRQDFVDVCKVRTDGTGKIYSQWCTARNLRDCTPSKPLLVNEASASVLDVKASADEGVSLFYRVDPDEQISCAA